jgi:DNA-binding SARP family transcriptional activator
MVRLKLLGTPAVEPSGKAPGRLVPWRKPLAVLALLAATDDSGLSRDKLHALLWPEATHISAAHALNQVLHVLRRDLGIETLFLGSSELQLNAEQVASDLAEFREAWRHAEPARAVSLYAGPFLDGFYLRDTPEFEHWVESERARLARAYGEALGALAAEAAARGEHERAAEWWRCLADQAPLNSGVVVRLMSSLAAAGDRAGALQHAETYQALIREELGAAPSGAVLALAARLRGAEDSRAQAPRVSPVSLAVGPFLNLSTARRNKLFVDGLTAEITNALCQVEGIQIIAAPADGSKAAKWQAQNAGPGPRADLTLQGALREEAGQVRLTVQLIEVDTRRYLWSAQYRHPVEHTVSAQETLTRILVEDLRVAISRRFLSRS